jgi:hypothetical protein
MVEEETLNIASKSTIRAMDAMTGKPAIRDIKVPVEEPISFIPTRATTAPAAQEVDAIRAKTTPRIGSDISRVNLFLPSSIGS